MNEVVRRSEGLILDTCYFMLGKYNKTPAQMKLMNEANVTGGMFYAIEIPIRPKISNVFNFRVSQC